MSKESEKCKKSPDGKHEPDWQTMTVSHEGGGHYIDVDCKHCGRSGCVGTAETLGDNLQW